MKLFIKDYHFLLKNQVIFNNLLISHSAFYFLSEKYVIYTAPMHSLLKIYDLITAGKVSYLEIFWSVFSRIRTEYRPEKLRIWTLFTQW